MDQSKKILIKFPTRNRPKKFIEVFLKYISYANKKDRISFIITMDIDDVSMNTYQMKSFLDSQNNVKYFYGNSKSKIEAINADMQYAEEYDILLNASDDMIPVQPGYDDIIEQDMISNFPDMDGVLHYFDGRRNDINTFCIMGKKYYDRFGYIYNPEYISVFADNEFTEVSNILHKTKYFDRVLFHHGWVEYVGYDDLAQRNESKELYQKDFLTYNKRKSILFGIPYEQK